MDPESNVGSKGAAGMSLKREVDDEGFTAYDTFVDKTSDVAKNAEKKDTLKQIALACDKLKIIEQKIIKLKGVDL